MSNKRTNYSKKWLISRTKVAGGKRRIFVYSNDYSAERNTKRNQDWDNADFYSRMGTSRYFYCGKLNLSMLIRFLYSKVGENWDEVYKEYNARVPMKLRQYIDQIFVFVATESAMIHFNGWGEEVLSKPKTFNSKKFYIDPETNLLMRFPDSPTNKKTKGMDREEYRKYREKQKRQQLRERRRTKAEKARINQFAMELLNPLIQNDLTENGQANTSRKL